MSTRPRLLLTVMATLGLVAGLALGAGAVLAQQPAPTPMPSTSTGTIPIAPPTTLGTPTVLGAPTAGTTTVTGNGSGTAIAGSAIAYPIYAGTPGIAPDHTIVVTGVGQAGMANDGSDRPAAVKKALQAALADAKAQAETIAGATGLTITGVLSVNSSVAPYGIAVPMAAESGVTPNAPVPDKTISGPGYLAVSVTVAYQVD